MKMALDKNINTQWKAKIAWLNQRQICKTYPRSDNRQKELIKSQYPL